ncbi:MAG: D-alanine--D-alanine ligase [Ruminococcus sp.]|nr:D-alanine--D-alanine ligase [Ruminococcus sp.]MCD7800271.1 D-alanine--D-alanine ligase [Ruminococcus sp.]
MASKINVAVIFGGKSSEHEVSLVSAYNVIKNIPTDKYEVTCIGITKKGNWLYYPGSYESIPNGTWESNPDCTHAFISVNPVYRGIITLDSGNYYHRKIDVIFPVLHGKNGEDGTIQGLFELAQIPYVGCGVLASASCMDKAFTHMILESNGIKTAKFTTVLYADILNLDSEIERVEAKLQYPMFVKPANAGSSIGVSKANNRTELVDAINLAFNHDSKVVIEETIIGRETEIAVFGFNDLIVSVPGEIETTTYDFYDYEAKYEDKSTILHIPADFDEETTKKLQDTAKRAYKAMGCQSLSRCDFFVLDNGEVILNEINTLPGFTPISMYPKLMNEIGIDYPTLLDNLLTDAMEKRG